MQKKKQIDEKKIKNKKISKAVLESEIKRDMERTEREFLKKNEKSIRASFFKGPT